jgi:fucose 4-O-acetylase-like acetyltransferase
MSTQIDSAAAVGGAAARGRSNAVDIVKGIAIILVVIGHTGQGMTHRGWWGTPRAHFTEAFIYSFHMPAFFFVAGLFVVGSIAKRGARQFIIEKLKTIFYPYALMAILSAAIAPMIEQFRSNKHPFAWGPFLLHLIDGEVSWFLFVLFVCLMIALLTVRVPNWLRFVVAAAIGMTPAFGPPLTNQVLREFCFVAVGMWVGYRILRLDEISVTAAAVGGGILFSLQALCIFLFGAATRWTYIELGLTGIAALFLIARVLDGYSTGDLLAWIGRASLAIFLLSAFGQGAGREILFRVFHTTNFWLQLFVPSLLATAVPAIMWHQQDRLRLRWLFRWPF